LYVLSSSDQAITKNITLLPVSWFPYLFWIRGLKFL